MIVADHIKKATCNLDFLSNFYSSYNYNDWSVTVAFYTSLHIVEAAIYTKGKIKFNNQEHNLSDSETLKKWIEEGKVQKPDFFRNTTHEVRKTIVIENFGEISQSYIALYNDSFTARYYKYFLQKWQIDLVVKPAISTILEWARKDFNFVFTTPFGKS